MAQEELIYDYVWLDMPDGSCKPTNQIGIWRKDGDEYSLVSPIFANMIEAKKFALDTNWKVKDHMIVAKVDLKKEQHYRTSWGGYWYVSKVDGELVCTCYDYKAKKMCEHTADVRASGIRLENQISIVLPTMQSKIDEQWAYQDAKKKAYLESKV